MFQYFKFFQTLWNILLISLQYFIVSWNISNREISTLKVKCFHLAFFSASYFFYCSIDATAESPYLGRLINHSVKGNLTPRILGVGGTPRLYFYAARDINVGEQLSYNYGENRQRVLKTLPWLRGDTGQWEMTVRKKQPHQTSWTIRRLIDEKKNCFRTTSLKSLKCSSAFAERIFQLYLFHGEIYLRSYRVQIGKCFLLIGSSSLPFDVGWFSVRIVILPD